MALSLTFPSNSPTSFLCILSVLLLSSSKGTPVYGAEEAHKASYHVVNIKSLEPNPYCLESNATKDHSKSGSLRVVHKHGPCSHLNQQAHAIVPTLAEIMYHDQSRVDSIQYRLRMNSDGNNADDSKVTIPAMSGYSMGILDYVVTLGFGTPQKDLTLTIDTGSDITWIQCLPCISCYPQEQSIFNASASRTFKNVSCNSPQCAELSTATEFLGCSDDTDTCLYSIEYGDSSYTSGFFGSETLTLSPSDIFPNFFFGCGLDNQGIFSGAAGLLGLGRNQLSAISQISSKYGNYFSYCLPTFSSSSGTLIFGKQKTTSPALKFTTLLTNSDGPSFYYIDLIGIKVGGKSLSLRKSVFKNPGTIIDSGTVVTRLPPEAYTALRTRFQKLMMNYSMTEGVSLLDTCYDFSNSGKVVVPTISFLFGGHVEVQIDVSGIFYAVNQSVSCLAFAGNSDPYDIGIFGTLQQQTLDVVYDVAGGKIGFGIGGCS